MTKDKTCERISIEHVRGEIWSRYKVASRYIISDNRMRKWEKSDKIAELFLSKEHKADKIKYDELKSKYPTWLDLRY